MTAQGVSADILGRLLVGLQALDAFSTIQSAARFVEQAVAQIPGVASVEFTLIGESVQLAEASVHIPVDTSRRSFGRLNLVLCDADAFAPYSSYLSNTGHAVATTLENRQVATELSDANALLGHVNRSLEERVSERTYELELTNSMLRALSSGNEAMIHAHSREGLERGVLTAIVHAGGFVGAWLLEASWAQEQPAPSIDVLIPVSDTFAGEDVTAWLADASIRAGVDRVQREGGLAVLPAGQMLGTADTVLVIGIADEQPRQQALCVATRERRWTSDELGETRDELLRGLAQDLAYGLQRQRVEARARDAFTQAIVALGSTVEIRDPYTAGHQQRVSDIAGAIAEELDWPDQTIEGIRLAASIHDIGKIAIPAEILTKPGLLSDLEMSLIRTHSAIGADVLRHIDFPWPIATMIEQHHERLDGSGYPHSLTAESIIPGARVLMVADVAEAMTHSRPYRSGLGLEAATAELTRGRGTRYDARVVDALLNSPVALSLFDKGANG